MSIFAGCALYVVALYVIFVGHADGRTDVAAAVYLLDALVLAPLIMFAVARLGEYGETGTRAQKTCRDDTTVRYCEWLVASCRAAGLALLSLQALLWGGLAAALATGFFLVLAWTCLVLVEAYCANDSYLPPELVRRTETVARGVACAVAVAFWAWPEAPPAACVSIVFVSLFFRKLLLLTANAFESGITTSSQRSTLWLSRAVLPAYSFDVGSSRVVDRTELVLDAFGLLQLGFACGAALCAFAQPVGLFFLPASSIFFLLRGWVKAATS